MYTQHGAYSIVLITALLHYFSLYSFHTPRSPRTALRRRFRFPLSPPLPLISHFTGRPLAWTGDFTRLLTVIGLPVRGGLATDLRAVTRVHSVLQSRDPSRALFDHESLIV